jgi:hypothetical protein
MRCDATTDSEEVTVTKPQNSPLSPIAGLFCRIVLCAVCGLAFVPLCEAANNFVPIKLPHGVQVDLPINWEALSNNQRITLDSAVQALAERNDSFDASDDLNFAANYYDDAHKVAALMNIRYYPKMEVTQAEARAVGPSDIQELDSMLRDGISKGGPAMGVSLVSWHGTTKQVINGTTAFVTEYTRAPQQNNGNFRVRLVRVFNGSKSFTLTVSYRERQEYLLRPICDRIISSLRTYAIREEEARSRAQRETPRSYSAPRVTHGAPPASAAPTIYKCLDAKGSILFTNEPRDCASNSGPAARGPLTSRPQQSASPSQTDPEAVRRAHDQARRLHMDDPRFGMGNGQ